MKREIECRPLEITTFDGTKMKVVNYPALIALDADVYLIFGMRSFGKSYGIKEYVFNRWLEYGEQFVVMRTIEDDITQSKVKRYLSDITDYFNEQVKYEKELCVYGSDIMARSLGNNKEIIREKIGAAMSLSGWLKYKGNSYEKTTTIILEEFLERKSHLSSDDFIEGYLNNLSTVIRLRQNVKVFCLANTVRKKSPIFDYYNIKLEQIEKGKPCLFSEDNGLRICVYWTPDIKIDSASSKHYTVDNSKSAKMIISGAWEESEYLTTYEGINSDNLQTLRRYRQGVIIYLKDCDCTIFYPAGDAPPLFIKGKGKIKPHKEMTLKDIAFIFPNIFTKLRIKIMINKVVHDGMCADVIDYIKDKIL